MPPRPPKPTPKPGEQSPLEHLVGADRAATLPPDLVVRFDVPGPTSKALKALGVADPAVQKLLRWATENRSQIAETVRADRSFTETLTSDPAKALAQAGAPPELVTAINAEGHAQLITAVRGVQFDLGSVIEGQTVGDAPTASSTASVQLLADTFASVQGNPANEAALRADPGPFVLAAAAAHPPQGVAAGSAAAASIVQQVTDAIRGAVDPTAGSSGSSDPWAIPIREIASMAADQVVRMPVPRGPKKVI